MGWVFVHEEAEDQRLFVTVAWDIWKNRCATTFEGKMRAANICSEVENLLAVQHDEKERNDSQQPRVWFPPPQGHLAIHVDAACDQNGRRGGGAICRNWWGELLSASTSSFVDGIDVEHTELLAGREGLKLALRFDGVLAIIWSYLLFTIMKLNDGCHELHHLQPLVVECLHLAELLSSCTFRFTHHDGNNPARLLARWWGLHSPLDTVGKTSLLPILHGVTIDIGGVKRVLARKKSSCHLVLGAKAKLMMDIAVFFYPPNFHVKIERPYNVYL